jgi:integrase
MAEKYLLGHALDHAAECQELANRAQSTRERGEISGRHLGRHLGLDLDMNAANLVTEGELFMELRQREGATAHTVSKEVGFGCMGLRRGRKLGVFLGDPASFVPEALHDVYQPRTRALTREEFAPLLEAERRASGRCSWAIPRGDELLAYVLTGARQSELFAIDKSDVDLSRRVLRIKGTKTSGAVREVPILDPLMPTIKRRMKAPGPMLFGAPWHRARMHQNLRRWCAIAEIEPVTANDLRRTYATWLAESGVPESLLLKYMGHTSSTMLRRVYSQTTDRMHADAIAAFGSVLGAEPGRA